MAGSLQSCLCSKETHVCAFATEQGVYVQNTVSLDDFVVNEIIQKTFPLTYHDNLILVDKVINQG